MNVFKKCFYTTHKNANFSISFSVILLFFKLYIIGAAVAQRERDHPVVLERDIRPS